MGDEGASPREILLEACRRNNTSLLTELLSSPPLSSDPTRIADLLNTARDGVGSYCLHIAAQYGSYEVMDNLLDQEGLEVDPIDRLEADTPLHKSIRFVNGLPSDDWAVGTQLVELLLDAGADPRVRNKAKLKAIELVDPRNKDLRAVLQKAEFALMAGDDIVQADGDDERGAGSASDSD